MIMQDVLKGQVALVTGASRGIGAAIVQALGQKGATIVGVDINEAAAGEIQKVLDAAGFPGWGAVLDVTDGAACEALIGEIEKRFGAVTILINNAGITRDNLAMRMKDDEWDAVINTNLKPVFRLRARIARLEQVDPGESAGFRRGFRPAQPTRVALLPVGHTDGYPISGAGTCEVLIGDRLFADIQGRFSRTEAGRLSASRTSMRFASLIPVAPSHWAPRSSPRSIISRMFRSRRPK